MKASGPAAPAPLVLQVFYFLRCLTSVDIPTSVCKNTAEGDQMAERDRLTTGDVIHTCVGTFEKNGKEAFQIKDWNLPAAVAGAEFEVHWGPEDCGP